MASTKSKKISPKTTLKTKDKTKNKKPEAHEEENVEKDGDVESFPVKGKKVAPVVIDDHPEVEIPEEKVEDEVVVKPEDVEDLLADELTLDDDELNPFGDKWEE